MNAIILAAGKSTRMYKGGVSLPKGLLPILNIPNIERTIIMLHLLDIYEIIIAVPFESYEFDYLNKKYSCRIVHIPMENKNTLTTINYILNYIDNSYIIEGDVVCAKNIFCPFEYSTYYTMNYTYPEDDEWNVITSSDNRVIGFEIGTHLSPAIFGISYWSHKDCPLLRNHLKAKVKSTQITKANVFWDDFISELLEDIYLKTFEISPDMACEMNTVEEYQYARTLCEKTAMIPALFFDNTFFKTKEGLYHIAYSTDMIKNLQWLNKLLNYYNEPMNTNTNCNNWFNQNEVVFIIKNVKGIEIAFFSLAIQQNDILLRRLYIDAPYRAQGIGKRIIHYIQFFTISIGKKLRVNVYDEKIYGFYEHLGARKIFSTYEWHLLSE